MRIRFLAIAAAVSLLIGSTAILQAQSRGGVGGGASGTSPGHEMKQGQGRGGPGASRLAPGHDNGTTGAGDRDDFTTGAGDRDDFTTGSGAGRDDDDRARHDTDGLLMDDSRRGIDKE